VTAGVGWSFNATTGAVTLTAHTLGGGNRMEFTDMGSNLIYFLTGYTSGGQIKMTLGDSSTLNPTLTFTPPAGTFTRWQRQLIQPAATTETFYGYTFDGTTYAKSPAVNLTQINATMSADGADTYSCSYNFMETPAKLATLIGNLGAAGGIAAPGNITLTLTPFGPALTWTEQYNIGAGFNAGQLGLAFNEALAITVLNRTVTAVRGQILACGHNSWAPLSLSNFNPPWHFPRLNRCVGTKRTVNHNGANEPWQTNTGSYTSSEPPNVVNFYEWQPIQPLSVSAVQASVYLKAGFSYLGPLELTYPPPGVELPWPDTTGLLLAQWLAAGGTDMEAYKRAMADFGEWPNSTEAAAIENVAPQLRHQVEQFNVVASESNGIPVSPAKGNLGEVGTAGWTLDCRSCFIVSGGSGYHVGDQLGPNTGQSNTVLVQVTSVDSNGAITGFEIISDATPMAEFDAYETPLRPFGSFSGSPLHGSGATWDMATGDGSALTFIPTYNPIGVPVPSGLAGSYWPRGAYFSWNGPTPGGADPVGTYLAALGMTVQNTLPDGYGTALANPDNYILYPNGSVVTESAAGYACGCTPAFAVQAATYRWVTVDSVRPVYAAFSLPFTLNTVLTPMAFVTYNMEGVLTTTTQTFNETDTLPRFFGPPAAPTPLSVNNYAGAPPGPGNGTGQTDGDGEYPSLANNGGGPLGPVSQYAIGFLSDVNGNWTTTQAGNLCRPDAPAVAKIQVPNLNATSVCYNNFVITQPWWYNPAIYQPEYFQQGIWQCSWTCVRQTTTNTITLPPRVVAPTASMPAQSVADQTAAVVLLEGRASLCAACIPVNYSRLDLDWAAANQPPIQALGTSIIPIVVDNTVETGPADIFICNGAGGVASYETVITTGLSNATLQTFSVDSGTPPAASNLGAGDTGTVPGPDSTPGNLEGIGAGDTNVGAGN